MLDLRCVPCRTYTVHFMDIERDRKDLELFKSEPIKMEPNGILEIESFVLIAWLVTLSRDAFR